MSDLNKAMIIGRLGRDPEVKYTPGGTAVANFSLATTDKWKDKQSGELREKTEWHRIVAFGRLGEICGEYLSKGKQVFIEGRLRTRSWEKDGITRYATEIEAVNMQLLGGGGGQQQQAHQHQPREQMAPQQSPQQHQYGEYKSKPAPTQQPTPFDGYEYPDIGPGDNDIPF